MHTVRFCLDKHEVCVGELIGDTIYTNDSEYLYTEVELLPPTSPSKIICVGLNYADHAAELNMEIPSRPLLFVKTPNTVLAARSVAKLLPENKNLEYEAELGVAIKKQCSNVLAEDADDVILGYTCVNDISNRADQTVEDNWVRAKSFDNSAPIGPVITSPDAVPESADIELKINGETRQQGNTSDFIFSIPEIIEEITKYITLEKGDLIATGTPAGVGPLQDGDQVMISIDGIPPLTHSVSIPN